LLARIAVIPGDGIGLEVTEAAMEVASATATAFDIPLELEWFDYGAEAYLKSGVALPDGALESLRDDFDAIYLGALGDPRVPDMAHAKQILLGLRFGLDLFVNQRPVKLLHERLCPLKGRGVEDIDFVVFRENTEGLYVGVGGIFKKGTPDELAVQEDINTRKGVERIIRHAFDFARREGRRSVVMSDKSNVLRFGHDLWQRVFEEVRAEYPEIESRHLYVDALTMQMIKNPAQFDVIVTCNMFGDIITDLGAQLQGGLGVASSANINPQTGVGLFEPVHGSAPKYAGQGVANPIAAILTVQLMFEFLGHGGAGQAIESAVGALIAENQVTRDLGGGLDTAAVGRAAAERIGAAVSS
jgi:3-isopropylmalate dehydrogenase